MAGFDKVRLMDKLIALGWSELNQTGRGVVLAEGGNPDYILVAPEDLYINPRRLFHVYEARDLQNLLGESIDED
jgi:hypothetical protein